MSILDVIFTIKGIIQEIKFIVDDVNESKDLAKEVAKKLERVSGLLTESAKYTNAINIVVFEQFCELVKEIKSTIAVFTRKNTNLTDRLVAFGKLILNRKKNIQMFQGYMDKIDIFLKELTQLFTIQGNAAIMKNVNDVRNLPFDLRQIVSMVVVMSHIYIRIVIHFIRLELFYEYDVIQVIHV